MMNREEKIKIYTEGLERGMEMAIERAYMVQATLYGEGNYSGEDGANNVVYELKKLKEALKA